MISSSAFTVVLNLPCELWFNGQCLLCPNYLISPFSLLPLLSREWENWDIKKSFHILISWSIFVHTSSSSYELDMYRIGWKISRTPKLNMKIFMPNIFTLEQWLCCTAAGVSPIEVAIHVAGGWWEQQSRRKKWIMRSSIRLVSFPTDVTVGSTPRAHTKLYVLRSWNALRARASDVFRELIFYECTGNRVRGVELRLREPEWWELGASTDLIFYVHISHQTRAQSSRFSHHKHFNFDALLRQYSTSRVLLVVREGWI